MARCDLLTWARRALCSPLTVFFLLFAGVLAFVTVLLVSILLPAAGGLLPAPSRSPSVTPTPSRPQLIPPWVTPEPPTPVEPMPLVPAPEPDPQPHF